MRYFWIYITAKQLIPSLHCRKIIVINLQQFQDLICESIASVWPRKSKYELEKILDALLVVIYQVWMFGPNFEFSARNRKCYQIKPETELLYFWFAIGTISCQNSIYGILNIFFKNTIHQTWNLKLFDFCSFFSDPQTSNFNILSESVQTWDFRA